MEYADPYESEVRYTRELQKKDNSPLILGKSKTFKLETRILHHRKSNAFRKFTRKPLWSHSYAFVVPRLSKDPAKLLFQSARVAQVGKSRAREIKANADRKQRHRR